MRTLLLLISFICVNPICFSQTNSWQKGEKELIYQECLSHTSNEYKFLSQDQRETISLCYVDEITSKYKKDEYQSLIDAQLKRIKSATIIHCAKNLGLELTAPVVEKKEVPVKPVSDKPTKEKLRGHWSDEESTFWLYETGDFKMNYNDGGDSKGTWKIDGDVLTLYHSRFLGTKQKDFKILMFTEEKFVYQSVKNRKDTFTVVRIK